MSSRVVYSTATWDQKASSAPVMPSEDDLVLMAEEAYVHAVETRSEPSMVRSLRADWLRRLGTANL